MRRYLLPALVLLAALALPGVGRANVPEVVVNVDDQQMIILKDGQEVAKYKISTSRFGLGDEMRSYKTPAGILEVCDKSGENLPVGAVIKGGKPTGEVLPPNAPGRDPIVTRVIRLKGLEAQNCHARQRGIWIHGTVEEDRIGKPVSWGCIRMRSQDVVELYKLVQVGTRVVIQPPKGHSGFLGWLGRMMS